MKLQLPLGNSVKNIILTDKQPTGKIKIILQPIKQET
jgi:hypothetical protein